jgi:hypothetical protein
VQVIEYLGRYTHRVAISNHRIVAIENDKVSFRYKDYADGSKQKVMTLEATEFLRRFCLHILPPRFRKIRYYGFMANTNSALLQVQQKELGIFPSPLCGEGSGMRPKEIKRLSWKLIAKQKLNYDADLCPVCKKGTMVTLLHFDAHAPPDAASLQTLTELLKGKTA